jgi:hypothetical protein
MAQIAQQLQAIAEKPDQKQKLELYKQLLQNVLESPTVEACNAFVDHSEKRAADPGGYGGALQEPRAPRSCLGPACLYTQTLQRAAAAMDRIAPGSRLA